MNIGLFPPESLLKKLMKGNVPKWIIRKCLKNKGLKNNEIDTILENYEAIVSYLGEDKIRELVDIYFRPKKLSAYVFLLEKPLFNNTNEIFEKLKSQKLFDKIYKNRKIRLISYKPILKLIYYNEYNKSIHFIYYSKGKVKQVITSEGEIKNFFDLAKYIVTLRPKEKIVDIMTNGNISGAKASLHNVLNRLNYNDKVSQLRFNSLEYIDNMLKNLDKVGYISLEFSGPGIGKISYSGRRGYYGYKEDLRSLEEVKDKIRKAFSVGYITRLHGSLRINFKPNIIPCISRKYNDVTFGINFRQNKFYVFSRVSEYEYYILLKFISNKPIEINDAIRRKEKLLDYFLNERIGIHH